MLCRSFLALANYVAIGKLAQQLQLSGRFLNTKVIAIGFFTIDIICIGVQGAGAAILSSAVDDGTNDNSRSGENIVLIGLAVQLVFFASFTFVALHVCRLQRKNATVQVSPQVFVCLFTTIALITLRNVYRLIELADGWEGKYNTHEVYFYCLDALPIFTAFVVYSLLHLGRYIRSPVLHTASGVHDLDPPAGSIAMSSYANKQGSSVV